MTVSATLALNDEVARRRRAGLPTVPLGFGEAGLPVHPLLKDELARWAGSASYGPAAGVEELRTAAAGYWTRRGLLTEPDQVVAGPGSKALLWALLGETRGAVALARPSWVSYAAQASLHGVVTHLLPTAPGHGGVPDPDLLDETARRARHDGWPLKTVVLTLPDNPTGTLAAPNAVAAVCEVAREHDLLVISDEIYRDLVHDDTTPFVSPAELAPERVVVTTGLSKNLALGGWRTGVARFPDRDLRDRVVSVGSEVWSCVAQPVQRAAALAFDEPPELRERVRLSRRLHARVGTAVADMFLDSGADLVRPNAGFYLYPAMTTVRAATDVEIARTFLEDFGVATLPGSAFGDDPANKRLRVATSLLYGEDDDQRERALRGEDAPWITLQLDRIARALGRLLEQ
ncbi:pyridoxal phosphate-dependent aminotransferase [Umezawaea sp. NPDC059074]|uniref:pyridoxal phosphate-dependent aminotransferase n=1 Tax=Umezawaea sp. NPDC059074 TaxID=3346716 RepID=UPI00367E497F